MAGPNQKREDEMTPKEAAVYLGYTSLNSFYRIAVQIPHRRFRARMYFRRDALDGFRKSQSVDHTPKPAA